MKLIVCLYMLILFTCTEAVGIAEGKEFVISTPSMKIPFNNETGYPRLVLTIMSNNKQKIKVLTEGLTGTFDFLQKDLSIEPFQAVKFYNERLFFGPDMQSGIRWTYHLTGGKPFVVMVSLETNIHIAETFMAVPVECWGSRYAAANLDKHASVVLIAGKNDNELTVQFKGQETYFTLTINGFRHEPGSEFKINLLKYQSYSIDNCGKYGGGTLTGSTITGTAPFGVVSGNCNGYTQIRKCNSEPGSTLLDGQTGTTVAEMLLPTETLGVHFIMFNLTGRSSSGYVLFVAFELTTVIKVTVDIYTKVQLIVLREIGDWQTRDGEFSTAHSSSPVYAMYVQNSTCFWTSEGDPSLLMLIPFELFYYIYYCIVPKTEMRHFITVVINIKFQDSLQTAYIAGQDPILGLASTGQKQIIFDDIVGAFNVLEYEVKRGVSLTMYSPRTRFGCYVHGVSPYSTYMHTAGFISSNINKKFCEKSEMSMKKGDLLDNDCDGWVDEEDANGIDDDLIKSTDKLAIDEDLGFYFQEGDTINTILTGVPSSLRQQSMSTFTNDYIRPALVFSTRAGQAPVTDPIMGNASDHFEADFSEWTDWHCTDNCNISSLQRTRYCLRKSSTENCTGVGTQTKDGYCYEIICPLYCPANSFGIQCANTCPHCIGDCDKFNGSCKACFPGFEYPENGCKIDIKRYFPWTEWRCTGECGEPFMVRERKGLQNEDLCREDITNCLEIFREIRPGDCNIGQICSRKCKEYTWGPECNNTCTNCMQPCNISNGHCLKCRAGFHDRLNACNKPCGANRYGPGCAFNCSDHCGVGRDCIDRVHGTCVPIPSSDTQMENYVFIALIVIAMVAISTCLYFAVRDKTPDEPQASRSVVTLKGSRSVGSVKSKSKQSLLTATPSKRSLKATDSRPAVKSVSSTMLSKTTVY